MGKVSLREAVKQYNVSRPTLQKALKSGKVSGVQDGKGIWQVDTAELARVYQARPSMDGKGESSQAANLSTQNRALPGKDDAEIAALRAALDQERMLRAAAEALAEERKQHIADLRLMLPAPNPNNSLRREKRWPWWSW
jgi:DNA-binding FadR family transcriptional regulator